MKRFEEIASEMAKTQAIYDSFKKRVGRDDQIVQFMAGALKALAWVLNITNESPIDMLKNIVEEKGANQ